MISFILAILNLGPVEIVVILLVALLVFGRRLPEVARSLGQGLVEFRKGLRDEPGRSDVPRPLPENPTETIATTEDASSEEVAEYDADVTEEESLAENDASATEEGEGSRPAG